jgi:ATP-binding cassette subfamily F protein 3
VAGDLPTQLFRDFLGKWNFPGDRAFESIDGFSGGEKARLALAMIAFKQPNVLLLDEPTNHLDLDMREALAEALSDFDGAIVLVSHDRHLIGLVCDTFVRVADGKVEEFDGDLDQYAAWLRSRPGSESAKAAAAEKAKPAPAAAPPPAPKKPEKKINAHALAKAEARVASLEAEIAQVEAALADPALYAEGKAKAADLGRRQTDLQVQLERAEADLLALYDTA